VTGWRLAPCDGDSPRGGAVRRVASAGRALDRGAKAGYTGSVVADWTSLLRPELGELASYVPADPPGVARAPRCQRGAAADLRACACRRGKGGGSARRSSDTRTRARGS